jgi:predicted phage-related endonuclease
MPDKELKTLSATQSAALFDVSPYTTRWLLWKVFSGLAELDELDAEENERMFWGTALEPVIFAETLRRLNLEGRYNANQDYLRHPTLPLGCTPDGEVWHPSKGKAVVQVKCTDWLVWKNDWTDDTPPPHIVSQVQHEMLAMEAEWAVIPCLINGNELRLYELYPDLEFQAEIISRAKQFFKDVEDGNEPDPLGVPIEQHELLKREYKPKAVADVTDSEEAFDAVQALRYHTPLVAAGEKAIKLAKAKLLALSGGCEIVKAHSYGVAIKQSPTKESVVELPGDIKDRLQSVYTDYEAQFDDEELDAIGAAINWRKVTRKGGVMTKYDTWEETTDAAPAWVKGFDAEILGA